MYKFNNIELLEFQSALIIYYDDDSEVVEINSAKKKIAKQLNKKSAFIVFKRWIVKENDTYHEEFKEFID